MTNNFFKILGASLLSFLLISFVNRPLQKKAESKRITSTYDSLRIPDLDSLKWIMYSLNYDKKAEHYRFDSNPQLNVLECDILLANKVVSIQDTVLLYFSFYFGDEDNIYIPKGSYYCGLGFDKQGEMFPLSNVAFPRDVCGSNKYDFYFKERQKIFIDFLKSYKGVLSYWLKNEAIRREVL